MVQDRHGTTQQMTQMQQHHATALAVVQEPYETVVGQVHAGTKQQQQFEVTLEESLHNRQQEGTTTWGDLQTQWQQWEHRRWSKSPPVLIHGMINIPPIRGDFCSLPTGHLHGLPDGSPAADDTTNAGCSKKKYP
jgi:hypothetical protein